MKDVDFARPRPRARWRRARPALLALALAACGGNGSKIPATSETPDAGPTSIDVPTDSSADGLVAFFDALEYHGTSWATGKDAPSEPESGSLSPHGRDLIFYNQLLRQSIADGHGSLADPHTAGSMAVKEIYTGDQVVGHAAMLRTDRWIYFCTASEDNRCYSGAPSNEVHYQTSVSSCSCHGGGTIITATMAPPP
jgi:hypothetical protein